MSDAFGSDSLRKLEAHLKVKKLKETRRTKIEDAFIPGEPDAKPFKEQIAFFSDSSFQKLMRCGNRSAKTFSGMRDMSWKIMRNHPYREKWNAEKKGTTYERSKRKCFWILAPTYDFVMETIWGMYLKNFIPEWYYTKDDGTLNISYHPGPDKIIKKITFRNGDTLEFKSYSQTNLSLMGRKIDDAYLDEMPPHPMIISEVITRTLDRDGETTMGFTPLVEHEEIKRVLDDKVKSGVTSLHSWGITANPLYRDNPERLARALNEWSHLPEGERNARIRGDWYYEAKHGKIFKDADIKTVDDFKIPSNWRRACFADPAAKTSGISLFAEDPATNVWYCYKSIELGGKGKRYDGDTIAKEIISLDESPMFVYRKYDNAEAWFGASPVAQSYGFTPCLHKNVNAAIMECTNKLNEGKIVLFKEACSFLLAQIRDYEWGANGKPKDKNKYHVLDTLMYFSREIPSPKAEILRAKPFSGEHELVLEKARKMHESYKIPEPPVSKSYPVVVKSKPTLRLKRRLKR